MNQLLIISVLCIVLITTSKAQKVEGDEPSNKINHFAIGYNLNDFGHDFGVGINLTSPYFANKAVAIRVSENYQWLSHLDNSGKYIWTGYHNIRIGAIGGKIELNNFIRLYGEGGITVLLNPNTISATNLTIGGYGLFGFEFFPKSGGPSYFIEMGGIGTGATAEKVPASPIYSNGFMISVGFRFYL